MRHGYHYVLMEHTRNTRVACSTLILAVMVSIAMTAVACELLEWVLARNTQASAPKPYHRLQTYSHHAEHVLGDQKILLFVTTSMSSMHIQFIEDCWPIVARRSGLLQLCDVLFFATSDTYSTATSPSSLFQDYVQNLIGPSYPTNGTKIQSVLMPNPGYQEGAILAMHEAMTHRWFDGYDWVIRLNPDVLVMDDGWIIDTMADPDVDAIFSSCEWGVHTDFMIFRPRVLGAESFNSTTFPIAEQEATFEFRNVTDHGRHRMLPGQQHAPGWCRVTGKESPVVHDHNMVPECSARILS